MNQKVYDSYIKILNKELIPALGHTPQYVTLDYPQE